VPVILVRGEWEEEEWGDASLDSLRAFGGNAFPTGFRPVRGKPPSQADVLDELDKLDELSYCMSMTASVRQKPPLPVAHSATNTTLTVPRLSASAADFVAQHPDQAAIAVTAALEAAAAQYEELELAAEPQIPERLRRFVASELPPDTDTTDELFTVEEAAKQLKVTRQTVYAWIEARRMMGWRLTRRGTLTPAEQIVGPGELVPGIDRVLQIMPDPRMAWRFLSEESPFFDTPQRPIDVLKQGEVEQVLEAARATGEDFT
jgi:excisionase family DNA binding protein